MVARAGTSEGALMAAIDQAMAGAPATITAVRPTENGLVIEATGPLTGTISDLGRAEQIGGGKFGSVTVDIPNATFAAGDPEVEFFVGPFIAMRALRYRTADESGVRLRLVSSQWVGWRVQTTPLGLSLISPSLTRTALGVRDDLGAAEGGAARVDFNSSVHQISGGDSYDVHRGHVAFGHRFAHGVLRGLFTDAAPRQDARLPRGAIGFSEIRAGNALFGVAGGDVRVTYGLRESLSASLAGDLQFRGGAVSALLPGGWSADVFGGEGFDERAFWIPGDDEPLRPLTGNVVSGAVARWLSSSRTNAVAFGTTASRGEGVDSYYNFLQAFERRFSDDATLRATMEQSFATGESQSGFAAMLEGDAIRPRFSLSGFYRYVDSEFRPPVGANFFATLRESYGATGRWTPSPRTHVSLNARQERRYDLYDRESAGTLFGYRSLSADRAVSDRWSVLAFYNDGESRSEPGTFVVIDSTTRNLGAGAAFRSGSSTHSLRVGWLEADNALRPERDAEGVRLDAGASYRFAGHSLSFAARHEQLATAVGDRTNWGASASYASEFGNVPFRTFVAYADSDTAALRETRQVRAELAVYPFGRYRADRLLGFVFGYNRADVRDLGVREGFSFRVDASRLLEWGDTERILPPSGDVLDVAAALEQTEAGRVRVIAFADANGNGLLDAGEQRVVGARIRIGAKTLITEDDGIAEFRLQPGFAAVAYEAAPELLDYVAAVVERGVDIRPRRVSEVAFPLVPAGRVVVMIESESDEVRRAAAGVSLIATREDGLTRRAELDSEGRATFGRLPVGRYQVTFDAALAARGLISVGVSTETVEVRRGQLTELRYVVRKATARERFGAISRLRLRLGK